MTLQSLLEELKRVDPETWEDVARIANVIRIQSDGSISTDADDVDFIMQGILQRAIAGRGWTWELSLCSDKKTYIADVFEIAPGYSGDYWEEDHEYLIAEKESTSPAGFNSLFIGMGFAIWLRLSL